MFLDEKGGKMSKSKGNVLEGIALLEKYPVDLIRFLLYVEGKPNRNLSVFSTDEFNVKTLSSDKTHYLICICILSKIVNMIILINQTQSVGQKQKKICLTSPDIWLLSKLQRLIQKNYRKKNQSCKFS